MEQDEAYREIMPLITTEDHVIQEQEEYTKKTRARKVGRVSIFFINIS